MTQYNVGNKHIDYYNAISSFILRSDYNTSTFIKMVETFPSLNQSISKLLDDNTQAGEIILTPELKTDIFLIIDDLEDMSTNSDFQFILNDLKNDLNNFTGKDKPTLISSIN